MSDEAAPAKRRPGRPTGSTTSHAKLRTLRMGPLWDCGQEVAKAREISMTALVEEALRRELARLERQDQRQAGE